LAGPQSGCWETALRQGLWSLLCKSKSLMLFGSGWLQASDTMPISIPQRRLGGPQPQNLPLVPAQRARQGSLFLRLGWEGTEAAKQCYGSHQRTACCSPSQAQCLPGWASIAGLHQKSS